MLYVGGLMDADASCAGDKVHVEALICELTHKVTDWLSDSYHGCSTGLRYFCFSSWHLAQYHAGGRDLLNFIT
jgi:hypothetical protein